MEIKIRYLDFCTCINPEGRIDSLNINQLNETLNKLAENGNRKIVIDFGKINYISSAGLRILIIHQKQLKNAGGELVFFGFSSMVRDIFKMSGFNNIFKIFSDFAEVEDNLSPKNINKEKIVIENEYFEIGLINTGAGKGSYISFYDKNKFSNSQYGREDVRAVSPSEFQYGIGLAVAGDKYDDYKNLFGEAVVVANNLFYYPAVKNPSVDFIINSEKSNKVSYKFLNGTLFNGEFRYLVNFKGKNKPAKLRDLLSFISNHFSNKLFGVILISESKGLYGINLKKVPVTENRIKDFTNILEKNTFAEWFNFPTEPSDHNSITLTCGIVHTMDFDPIKILPLNLPRDKNSHFHSIIFQKGLSNLEPEKLKQETNRIINDQIPVKVQHLLDDSIFYSGIMGLIDLGE